MRRIRAAAAAAALALCGALPAGAQMMNMKAMKAHGLSQVDTKFLVQASQNGEAEVKAAAVALQRSKNPQVDAFARRMAHDHDQANRQLTSIVESKGMTAPSGVGPVNEAMMAKMKPLHGAAFDRAYLQGQVKAHEMTIALFRREASNGSDAQVRSFARSLLPTLESHLAMARKDVASMSSSSGSM